MKNFAKLLGIAVVAVIGFSIIACGGGGGGGGGGGNGTRDPKTYTGTEEGVTYTLKIEDGGSRTVLTPTQGDKYTLTQTANSKKSTGKVNKVVGGVLTLSPKEDPDDEFTATVSGNNITAMSGDITWDDGTANTAPATLTPSGGTDPGAGGTFTLTGIPARFNGKYAYLSGTITDGGSGLVGTQSVVPRTSTPSFVPQTLSQISGGRVSIPMWVVPNSADGELVRYSGNDLCAVIVNINDSPSGGNAIGRATGYVAGFQQGNVTEAWVDSKWMEF